MSHTALHREDPVWSINFLSFPILGGRVDYLSRDLDSEQDPPTHQIRSTTPDIETVTIMGARGGNDWWPGVVKKVPVAYCFSGQAS